MFYKELYHDFFTRHFGIGIARAWCEAFRSLSKKTLMISDTDSQYFVTIIDTSGIDNTQYLLIVTFQFRTVLILYIAIFSYKTMNFPATSNRVSTTEISSTSVNYKLHLNRCWVMIAKGCRAINSTCTHHRNFCRIFSVMNHGNYMHYVWSDIAVRFPRSIYIF